MLLFMPGDSTPPNSDRQYLIFAVKVMGELVYLIAVPVVCFVLFGRWLDRRLDMHPWFLIGGFFLAAAVSTFAVWRRAKILGKEYQELFLK